MSEKKYYIYSTASGCTSSLWESAVYDDYYKTQGMKRVYSEAEADYIIVNTCSVTPSFENQSKKFIQRVSEKNLNNTHKTIIAAGCYSAIRKEDIEGKYLNVTAIKPLDLKHLTNASQLPVNSSYHPSLTNHFDDIHNCKSSLAHKIVWYTRKLARRIYLFFGKQEGMLLNFLDSMIFNNEFHVIEVGHGCAGGCTFCSIKQSRGFVSSREESSISSNFKKALDNDIKNFWILATDLGAWGLDRQKDPADLMEELMENNHHFRMVINYIEPRWLLTHPKLFKYLEDTRIIGVSIPIQSGNTQLVFESGRRYDPKNVIEVVNRIKKKNPQIMIKTNIMAGLPGENWRAFWDSAKAIFSFDIIVPVIYGVRPGTKASKKTENHIGPVTKIIRMVILFNLSMLRHTYVASNAIVKDFSRK